MRDSSLLAPNFRYRPIAACRPREKRTLADTLPRNPESRNCSIPYGLPSARRRNATTPPKASGSAKEICAHSERVGTLTTAEGGGGGGAPPVAKAMPDLGLAHRNRQWRARSCVSAGPVERGFRPHLAGRVGTTEARLALDRSRVACDVERVEVLLEFNSPAVTDRPDVGATCALRSSTCP
jgi:hypothetical protein